MALIYVRRAEGEDREEVSVENPLPVTIEQSDQNPTFPVALTLADNMTLPKTSLVGAAGMVYDGTNLDLARATVAAGTTQSGVGLAASAPQLMVSSGDYRPWSATGGLSDASTGGQTAGAAAWRYNGATYDRERANTEGTLLASAARVATTSSADQVNYNARGVRVFVNVTVVPTVETLTVAVQEKDPVSGNYLTLIAAAADAASGQKVTLVVYPGCIAVANVCANTPLGRTWRVTVTHSASGSFTYSCGFAYVL
jgi:hypothetical protein